MAKKQVADLWRTVSYFLDEEGVFEVMFSPMTDSPLLRCDCADFPKSGGCRHTAWVFKNSHHRIDSLRDSFRESPASIQEWRNRVLTDQKVMVI